MVFQIISILVLAAIAVLLHRDAKRRFGSITTARQVLWSAVRDAFAVGTAADGPWRLRTLTGARKGAYLAALILAGILAVTGFVQVIIAGSSPSGVILLVHMIAAPLFALTLAAASLLWSHDQQMREADLPLLTRAVRTGTFYGAATLAAVGRALYWLILMLALPLLLSIILSLFPLFGTDGETCLIAVHGYSALAIVVTALLHGYIRILQSLSGIHQG